MDRSSHGSPVGRGLARRMFLSSAASAVLSAVAALVWAGAGCVHRAGDLPAGRAGVCGCVEVVVHDDLDYLLPRQVRRSNIRVTLAPLDQGLRGAPWIRVHTGRDGCFHRDGMAAGRYRVVKIQAFGGRQGNPGLPTPDLEFDFWESALRVGAEGIRAVPTAEGRLDAVTFTLQAGEVRYLGHFLLEYQEAPFGNGGVQAPYLGEDAGLGGDSGGAGQAARQAGPACLTRMSRIKGIEGEVYLSSVPVGTRVCIEKRPDEAEHCSGR